MIKNNFEIIKLEQIKEPSGKYTIYGFLKINRYSLINYKYCL